VRYYGAITVPANTLESAPVTAELKICPGVLTEFYRLFPPGCAGLVHLQVLWQTQQIFPSSAGESYLGDGSEILGSAGFVIDEVPAILELRAWSPGTTYEHVVYAEFYIERAHILIPEPLTVLKIPEF